MASSNFRNFARNLALGRHNFGSDTLKVLLVSSIPSETNLDAWIARSDVTNEITGTGYSAGGIAQASITAPAGQAASSSTASAGLAALSVTPAEGSASAAGESISASATANIAPLQIVPASASAFSQPQETSAGGRWYPAQPTQPKSKVRENDEALLLAVLI